MCCLRQVLECVKKSICQRRIPFSNDIFGRPNHASFHYASIIIHANSDAAKTFELTDIIQDAVHVVNLVNCSFAHDVITVNRHGQVSVSYPNTNRTNMTAKRTCSMEDFFQQTTKSYACSSSAASRTAQYASTSAFAIRANASR